MEKLGRRDSFWAGIYTGFFVGILLTLVVIAVGYSKGVITNDDLKAYRKVQNDLKEEERKAFFDATVGPESNPFKPDR
jgi:hypothetical protein